jgi:hypothetical protein
LPGQACARIAATASFENPEAFLPASAAQRRQPDRDDADAVEEVLAEAALGHQVREVGVRGGDHPGVHRDLPAAAEPLDPVVLQEAEELDLEGRRQLADLVEEEGAAVRRLDAAAALGVGAGEGALLVAEELALEQRLRDRRAVDGHEGPRGPRGEPVDRAGRDLLARAALAREEDGGIDGRHLADRGEHLLHARARPEHPLEAAGRRALSQLAVLRLERVQAQRASQHDLELVHVDRLHEEVVPALLDGVKRVRALLAPGDDDDLGRGVERLDLVERGEALLDATRVGGQAEVERHDRRVLGAHGVERRGAVAGEHDVELVGEGPAHLRAQVLVVVDYEQFGLRGHAFQSKGILSRAHVISGVAVFDV